MACSSGTLSYGVTASGEAMQQLEISLDIALKTIIIHPYSWCWECNGSRRHGTIQHDDRWPSAMGTSEEWCACGGRAGHDRR